RTRVHLIIKNVLPYTTLFRSGRKTNEYRVSRKSKQRKNELVQSLDWFESICRELAGRNSRKKRRIVEKKSEHSYSRPTWHLFFVSLYTRRSDCKRLFGS